MLKSHFNIAFKEGVEEEEKVVKVVGKKKRGKPSQDPADNVDGEQTDYEYEGAEFEKEKGEDKISQPHRALCKSEISINLSMLGKTAEGDGYTYLKVSVNGLSLTEINAIKCFKHLQFVDVSNNLLELDALQAVTELPYLVLIHADKNLLKSAALKKCKYLQVMILNENMLTSVDDVFQPELSTLEAANNKIEQINFENKMAQIRCLDFRYNLINDLSNFNFPNLDSLYLAGNKIKSLIGIEWLVNLRILHLRFNPLRLLDGFDARMTKLQYLNLRNCKVSTLKQVRKLKVLTGLETLIMKGCPYMGGTGNENDEGPEEEDVEVRMEILATLMRLKRINKAEVTPEEREEAKDLMMQWLEEGEKDDEEEVFEEIGEEEAQNED